MKKSFLHKMKPILTLRADTIVCRQFYADTLAFVFSAFPTHSGNPGVGQKLCGPDPTYSSG